MGLRSDRGWGHPLYTRTIRNNYTDLFGWTKSRPVEICTDDVVKSFELSERSPYRLGSIGHTFRYLSLTV